MQLAFAIKTQLMFKSWLFTPQAKTDLKKILSATEPYSVSVSTTHSTTKY
jgi:hypothetical protein